MSVSDMFSQFIDNLAIKNAGTISTRYGEITAALNKQFRDTESKEANTLQVGSFGRKTGINGLSDLDMLYLMPKSKWCDYNIPDGQKKLLEDTKSAIKSRYPNTRISVDRLVVSVTYTNFYIEVQPVFENEDQSFRYPDTYYGGSWKTTKPREEMEAIAQMNDRTNGNYRRLCKMVRSWRNHQGIVMGGLLIDTLVYKFFDSNKNYDNKSFSSFGELSMDFFQFISNLEKQTEYAAPGSNQRVKVKSYFQSKGKKAYNLCLEAIAANDQSNVNNKWKKVYGRAFPSKPKQAHVVYASESWSDTEEFIEDKFPVDIRYKLIIDCKVEQPGFQLQFLREMLKNSFPLRANKKLTFFIKENLVPEPYTIMWKVLNIGEEAKKRNCIRGQILSRSNKPEIIEHTDFKGSHMVECYIIKGGVVVARHHIDVPIVNNK